MKRARFVEIRQVNGSFARLVDPSVVSAMVGLKVPIATEDEIRQLSVPKNWLEDYSARQRIVRQPAIVNALRRKGKDTEANAIDRLQSSFFLLEQNECVVSP